MPLRQCPATCLFTSWSCAFLGGRRRAPLSSAAVDPVIGQDEPTDWRAPADEELEQAQELCGDWWTSTAGTFFWASHGVHLCSAYVRVLLPSSASVLPIAHPRVLLRCDRLRRGRCRSVVGRVAALPYPVRVRLFPAPVCGLIRVCFPLGFPFSTSRPNVPFLDPCLCIAGSWCCT